MSAAELLLQHIQFRLVTRKICLISERELEPAWPRAQYDTEKRTAAILKFSEANNLNAHVRDNASRVRFKKLSAS